MKILVYQILFIFRKYYESKVQTARLAEPTSPCTFFRVLSTSYCQKVYYFYNLPQVKIFDRFLPSSYLSGRGKFQLSSTSQGWYPYGLHVIQVIQIIPNYSGEIED